MQAHMSPLHVDLILATMYTIRLGQDLSVLFDLGVIGCHGSSSTQQLSAHATAFLLAQG